MYHHKWISYIEVPCECRAKRAYLFALKDENLLCCLMGIFRFCQVVLQLKTLQFLLSWINSLSTESQASDITKLSFVKFSSRGAPHEWGWASGGVIEGVWASDRSAGVMRQVRRCKAGQDDGLINPATPQVQWERLFSQPRRLCNKEATEGAAQTSKAHTQVTHSFMLYHCFTS